MATIRVHKTKNYTVMSNTHLRDRNLSLKAKGLLSVMLSLPDNWDYSIAGLVAISKENETAVKSALNELKDNNYVAVTKENPTKSNGGRIKYTYEVYEEPHKQKVEKQDIENLGVECQQVENHGQLNTNELSTDELNINIQNTNELNTKSNSLDREQCNSFLPKDKKAKEFKPINEYSQSDWEVAEERMISRAGKIAYDWTNDKTLKENVEAFFKYFLDKHGEYTGEYHYPLTDKVLSRVVDNLTKETDIERDGYTDTYYAAISDMDDNTDYKMLVDEYFNTKFSAKCDYSLVHFSSEKVLINIMNHTCKSSWCESKEL